MAAEPTVSRQPYFGHPARDDRAPGGPELIQIYNDGYRVILDGRHPRAMGQRTQECWPEVWHFNAPIYEAVFRGECRSFTDQKLTILRTGTPEDAWFDLTYSPPRK